MTVRFARCLLVSFTCGCSVAPPPAGEVDIETANVREPVEEGAATACSSHAECAAAELCQVVDVPHGPGIAPVYVDDAAVVARNARVAVATGRAVQKAPQPECDGDCAPYTGDLGIRPARPLSICRPAGEAKND